MTAPRPASPPTARPAFPARHRAGRFPAARGLYDPSLEHDSCGVGFVAHVKGQRSHGIVTDADRILRRMTHRGACGCEANTGDGAGMLTALPHEFLARVAGEAGIDLPEPGLYAAGNVFLPRDPRQRHRAKAALEARIAEYGQTLLGWREVPTDPDGADVGPSARACMPHIEQVFVGAGENVREGGGLDEAAFDRALFLIRKSASRIVREESRMPEALLFYVCSLNARTLVYKGMLTPVQVTPFYPDLSAGDYKTHLAMVHSRFSTNTFPSWDRAQPLRNIAHNGEINTLRGNRNWMAARQGQLVSGRFDGKLADAFPICEPHLSDSGNFDNALELLLRSGRPLPEAVMLMIPEAWQNHDLMPENKRAFYEYHSALTEPWDGPASVSFTDGHVIGAVLDRNGLRPSRYYVTHDDRVVMASEVGVLDVAPENVREKGRLKPGRMFLVNFDEGRIVPDEELKRTAADRRPYAEWLREQRLELSELPQSRGPAGPRRYGDDELLKSLRAFGYSEETLRFMLLPLIRAKKDPIGSMGDDAALACLSEQPRLVPDYFKQLFAQVTNPAIDSIREEIVMSLECFVGPEGNLLNTIPEQCHRLRLAHPVLTDGELASLKALGGEPHRGWSSRTADFTFAKPKDPADAARALTATLDALCGEADAAIADGQSLLILSDRAAGPGRVAVPALLAAGAVHQHLIRTQSRTKLGLIVESGETREVHHFCTLVGYGADAVNPYHAFAAIRHARDAGTLSPHESTGEDWTDAEIVAAYRKGVGKGMLKVFAKMGISTLQSYKGAQIFEALGLGKEVIDRCFTGTPSRIKGVGFDRLARDAVQRHELGYAVGDPGDLPNPGTYAWRAEGEKHAWTPHTIAAVQAAARTGDAGAYKQFAAMVNEQVSRDCNLRGLVRFRTDEADPIDPEWVEPASEIVKRFCTGAMSYGSISAEAHETLAIAMNRLGGKSNTGEGGENPERFLPLPNGDLRRSAIKQVASGRFGVTSWYLTNADEIQIKISQGAKPGEGGELPGHKVDKVIASVRHSTPGVGLISPPPHHDIYSIEDLSQLIFDLKNANPDARVSVKLVSEVGVGTIAAGVAKGHADNILISGSSGGTGASPLTSIKHAGLPWELGIAETHQTLVMNDLRSRVRLQTDGQLKTGRDVAVACLLGAEEFGFSTAPLITLGCIMMRKCHLNTCPVGIATQDPALRKMFRGQPEHVVNYLFAVAEECREIMATLGLRTIDEMVGRADLLAADLPPHHPKAGLLDLSPVLRRASSGYERAGTYCTKPQDHGLDLVKDNRLIAEAAPALRDGKPVTLEYPIENIDRAFGTMLSHEVSKAHGAAGLPDGTITIRCEGSAGQSLGAWLAKGVTIEVTGDANDYVGKGLSGGRIVVKPPANPGFDPAENIILGNVALYGATSGELFARGVAAERFCVRNSGALAVVEGCGDHGCEYMTGGRAVILGETGRNFAAGMSGGVAYVHDPNDTLLAKTNLATVEFEPVEGEDADELKALIERHRDLTGSERAARLLKDWEATRAEFRKVMPVDYRRALAELAGEGDEAGMAAASAGETVTPALSA